MIEQSVLALQEVDETQVALVGGKGTAQAKMDALRAAGVKVGHNPTEAGELMAAVIPTLI